MRNMLTLGSLALLLTACPGNDGVKLEDVPDELEQAQCEFLVRCGAAADLATCAATSFVFEGSDYGTLEALVQSGNLTYDPDKSAECIDQLTPDTCSIMDILQQEIPPVCLEVFTGTVPDGGECVSDEECATGGECLEDPTCTTACCLGTCQPPNPAPTIVPIDGDCSGANTVCVDGAYCRNGTTCTAQVDPGATCDAVNACRDPSFCNIAVGTGSGTCYTPAAEGATCDPNVLLSVLACDRIDDYCDSTTNKCVKRIAVGQPCSDAAPCVAYARCTGTTTTTCVALPTEGQDCLNGSCAGDLTCDGATNKCIAPTANPVCTH